MIGPDAPRRSVEGFDGPLDLLLELVEEKKLDILTVRLGDLADAYLTRVRSLSALPAEEVSAFLALASRLVLLKARSLLPSLAPLADEDVESEEELRARLLEYAVVRERAGVLGARLRTGERAFPREGGTVELPPRGARWARSHPRGRASWRSRRASARRTSSRPANGIRSSSGRRRSRSSSSRKSG